jgi:hypothetical protein
VYLYVLNCHVWPVVKIATTRDQYVGLKLVVLSTSINVKGCDDIEGNKRWICNMFAEAEVEELSVVFGGVKTPSLRKVFALLVRSREDADGERRMMGWRRFCCRGFWRLDTRGALREGLGSEGRVRRNVLAILR